MSYSDKERYLYQKEKNTFRNQFLRSAETPIFTTMAVLVEACKNVFSKTIGLSFAYKYLCDKGPGNWEYDIKLYNAGMEMKEPEYVEQTLGFTSNRPAIYIGTNHYQGGAFSLPFALWNYVVRNLGKVVGLLIALPIAIVALPFVLCRAAYKYVAETIRINDALKNLPVEDEGLDQSESTSNIQKHLGVSSNQFSTKDDKSNLAAEDTNNPGGKPTEPSNAQQHVETQHHDNTDNGMKFQ